MAVTLQKVQRRSAGRILLGLLLQAGCVQPAQDLSWEEIRPGLQAASSHSAVLDASGTIWMFGAELPGNDDVWKFTSQDLSWEQIETGSPRPPANSAVLDHSGAMWVFGGWNRRSESDALWKFTTKDLSWEQIGTGSPWPPAMSSHSAVLDHSGAMWVFGGWNGSSASDALWKFTTQDLSWEQIGTGSPWPPAMSSHAAVLDHSGAMWVYGGRDFGSIWKFTTQVPEANDSVELVGTILPVLMGTHCVAAIFIFWFWYRWQPGDGQVTSTEFPAQSTSGTMQAPSTTMGRKCGRATE